MKFILNIKDILNSVNQLVAIVRELFTSLSNNISSILVLVLKNHEKIKENDTFLIEKTTFISGNLVHLTNTVDNIKNVITEQLNPVIEACTSIDGTLTSVQNTSIEHIVNKAEETILHNIKNYILEHIDKHISNIQTALSAQLQYDQEQTIIKQEQKNTDVLNAKIKKEIIDDVVKKIDDNVIKPFKQSIEESLQKQIELITSKSQKQIDDITKRITDTVYDNVQDFIITDIEGYNNRVMQTLYSMSNNINLLYTKIQEITNKQNYIISNYKAHEPDEASNTVIEPIIKDVNQHTVEQFLEPLPLPVFEEPEIKSKTNNKLRITGNTKIIVN